MALKRKTLNFLPSIFRTETNQKFLGSTLDQLINEPELKKINGFIGRKFSPTSRLSDNYVVESTIDRQNYQLEPAVVVRDSSKNVKLFGDYVDLINKIGFYGGKINDHNRLFESEYYTFDPQIDLDKFVNYSQYYWLPNGTETVKVKARSLVTNTSYTFSQISSSQTITDRTDTSNFNPVISLSRGTTYTLTAGPGTGNIWIQTEPGSDGVKDYAIGSTTRSVYGVSNNGTAAVTFTVPSEAAQNDYLRLPIIDVDFAFTNFTNLDNAIWKDGNNPSLTVDSEQFYPNKRYVIFTNNSNNSADWTDRNSAVVPTNRRRGVWQMNLFRDPNDAAKIRIRLEFVRSIPTGALVRVVTSSLIKGRQYKINNSGLFEIAPNITAPLSTLYYQINGTAICGEIKLINEPLVSIDINADIIGQTNYTSPTGVVFTNGLKINFDGTVTPSDYSNKTYIVEGVGKSIQLVDFDTLICPEIVGPIASIPFDTVNFDSESFDEEFNGSLNPDYIVCHRAGIDKNAWSRINRWVHIDTIKTALLANGLPISLNQTARAQRPIIEFKPNLQLFNHGSVYLTAVDQFFEAGKKINIQGIIVPFENISILVNQSYRTVEAYGLSLSDGQKVIFGGDTDQFVRQRIYQVGYLNQTSSTNYSGIITGTISAAINSALIKGVGTSFNTQLRIGDEIFNSSGNYLGRVYRILGNTELILESALNSGLFSQSGCKYIEAKITLSVVTNISPHVGYNIVVKKGDNIGNSYYLKNSTVWNLAQRKTDLNQAPLFDIFGSDNISFSKSFPNSNFVGTKIFSYKDGSGSIDSVLGFSLSYNGIGNFIGDINFVNNYSLDTFTYRTGIGLLNEIEVKVDQGYIKRIIDSSTYEKVNTWTPVLENSKQYQLVSGIYDGITAYYEIGVMPEINDLDPLANPNVKVFINTKPVVKNSPDDFVYAIETVGARHAVRVNHELLNKGDRVDILFYAKDPSRFAYYQIPANLEFNPLNADITDVSLGQLRNHLTKVGQNIKGLVGKILSANNLRDLDYSTVSGTLLKHSAPVVNGMAFLLDDQANFVQSVDYARKEYTRFKNKFLETAGNFDNLNIADIPRSVDKILESINAVKTASFPWYYSDMVAFGNQYNERRIVITASLLDRYDVSESFYELSGNQPSNSALLIYHNGNLLVKDRDYIFEINPTIQILTQLTIGDIILFREYTNTDGSFIPETPTKLGLYPKFVPEKFLDSTYRQPIYVIQGHDGSLTPAYNDFRDDLLLELEKRIYNNIKIEYNKEVFNLHDYIPGKFRSTDYSLVEFNQVLTTEFLKWVGSNQVDYYSNESFASSDPFTYNYNKSLDHNSTTLPGYWRGIYKYFYDTDRPHTHAWEMLGYTVKPGWWDTYYSWTNLVKRNALILAITNGITSFPNINPPVINETYKRANFRDFVPVDISGNLINPLSLLVRNYNSENFSGSFSVGDQGPVESAWRRSSEYPYALQRAMSLLKPAKYFGLLINTNKIQRSELLLDQYVNLDTNKQFYIPQTVLNGENINGSVSRATGYLNWISGYLDNLGIDFVSKIRLLTNNLEVNLSHKMAGFTDKKYITVLAEQFTPSSISESVILPDENYTVYLNKSIPVERVVYSAVIVEKTNNGWSVTGYNQKNPYFNIIPSRTTGTSYVITVLNERAVIYNDYKPEKLSIPYGFEFNRKQQLVDFLVGYQRYLVAQGFEFENYDSVLASKRDWILSAKEFLTWSQQGWPEGHVLVLSPTTDNLVINSTSSAVDTVNNRTNDSQLIGVNFKSIKNTEFTITRDNGKTSIYTLSGQTIALADLNLVQYEHVLIFDNVTVFNDIIYKPELGNRQYRLKIVGSVTNLWDGELTPPGFVYSSGEIANWQAGTDYHKGDIILYKNKNYTALKDISAESTFNFNYWSLLDSKIESGLIPNFAQNAALLENIYDIDNQPTNENFAKFSTGLIGYRNRSYLEDLGMDQTVQSKFYQGYIKEKGTLNSVSAIARGYFDNLSNEIKIYEEWGARLGEYGAIDTNPEITLALKESVHNNNPIAVELLNFGERKSGDLLQGLRPSELLSKTLNYAPEIFLNRNICNTQTWKIELFGDGILCGKIPDIIYNYSITLSNSTGNVYLYSVVARNPSTLAKISSINIGDEICFDCQSVYTSETLFISIEPVGTDERPESFSPRTELCFAVSSMNLTENLVFSVEVISDNEQPGAITGNPSILACRYNKSSGRTAEPPDYLLYQSLSDQFGVAITTRSVTGSDSTQLLLGQDGVNRVWPDDIEADIVLINHGIADARNNIPLSVYKNNLRALRNRLPKEKIIVWITPTPVNSNLATWAQNSSNSIADYARAMKEVARQFGDYLVDAHSIPNWLSYINQDGVHASQQGYQVYANTIIPVLKQAIRDRIKSDKKYYEDDLHSAGYPLVTEVDRQYFDISLYKDIDSNVLSGLYTGYRLWVAKDFNNDWQVYRAYQQDNILLSAELDINDKFVITCSKPHNLSIADLIAVRNFDDALNGFYQIFQVSENTITVYGDSDTTTYLLNNSVTDLSGELFDFQKLRFTSLSELENAVPRHNWNSTYIYSVKGVYTANSVIISAAVIGDSITFNVTGISDQEQLVYSIEVPVLNDLPNAITRSSVVLSNRDIVFVDDIEDNCGHYAVMAPEVDGYTFSQTFVSNLVYSNVYSVVSTDCSNISAPIISNVFSTGNTITFCVTSVNSIETLNWEIVAPTQADMGRTVVTSGNLATYTNANIVSYDPIYSYSTIRLEHPVVDIESINNLYLYSNESKKFLTKLDILDPAKGRVLGTAQQDIDFTTSIDPAKYKVTDSNSGLPSNIDYFWGPAQVGTYWWNMDAARFIHYEQSDLDYRLIHWAELFPGSAIEIYEWIESDYLPSIYITMGQPGTPLYADDSAYSDATYIDPNTNAFVTKYFYWVRGRTEKTVSSKRHSTVSIEDIITNPIKQNIPYMAALKDRSFAVYNVGQYLKAQDTVLYVSSQKKLNQNIIHSDFRLLQEGNPNIEFPSRIENKIMDSLSGQDRLGRRVPDPLLLGFNRVGLEIAPRQTVILNMFEARENVIKWVNGVLLANPVARRVLDKSDSITDNFYAKDDYPASTLYDVAVDTYADIDSVYVSPSLPNNQRRVLVKSDETLEGYWVIYTRTNSNGTYSNRLIKRQRFDVTKLWSFVNWYADGYSDKTIPTHIIDNIRDIHLLKLNEGDTVKVKNVTITIPVIGSSTLEVPGKFELYAYTMIDGVLKPSLVGLEQGTIQIASDAYNPVGFDSVSFDTKAFDYETGLEFRYILKGLKEDIFVEELDGYYNTMMFYIVDYILGEQKYVDWFFKTSFISVLQKTQGLQQYPTYIKDRQKYYESYINEVKPYRTKIREYILSYTNTDLAPIGLTDFDLPAYYDQTLKKFRSPNGEYSTIDQAKFQEYDYVNWYQNYKYSIESVDIASKGYGYFSCPGEIPQAPDLVLVRTDGNTGANAAGYIQLQSTSGYVQKVYVTDPGSNYTQTPITSIQGNGGTEASDREIYRFRAVSKGTSNSSVISAGLYNSKTSTVINAAQDGYTMHRIRRSDGRVTFTRNYDIANQSSINFTGNSSYDLAYDLGQTSSDFVVVVYSNGNPAANRFESDLRQAMYRCGASAEIFGSNANFKTGSAYILVGIPGTGKGNGIENYAGSSNNSVSSWSSLDFDIRRGRIIPITSYPRVYQLPTAFSFPVSPTIGNTYTYGNRVWTYNGTHWSQVTRPITYIAGEAEFRKAKLVPRLTNKTIRKISTTIKFDRVQYTTRVINWATGTSYNIGTVLSYQGEGYVVKANMPASDKFNYAYVRPVGNDQSFTSRYYRDAYFDNANDRIMAFYVATDDNNNVPKSIDRLVTGVQDSWATYNSTTQSIPLDTNLIGDTFGSNDGLAAGNILVVGGQFIDVLASHAPDELVPGIIYDSVSIRTITSTSTVQGFRLFIDMNDNKFSTDFSPSTITALALPLNRNDTTITVTDGSKLSVPNPSTITPGIIHVNGERITYYTKVGNVLGQIRRGVGGTGIAEVHLAGSEVEDTSIPGRSSSNYNNYNPS